MLEYIFTWSIGNFIYAWHKTGHYLVSPQFFANSMFNTAWTLRLYPRGRQNSDYLSLKLCREDREGPENLSVNIEFSCITADTSSRHSCFKEESFTNFTYGRCTETCFMQRNKVFGCRKAVYLPRGVLTLRCRIWKETGEASEFGESFGRTKLVIESIFSFESIDFENTVEETVRIQSKLKNKSLVSIGISCGRHAVDVRINTISDEKMKFATCNLRLEDKMGRKISDHDFCSFDSLDEGFWRLPFSEEVLLAGNENLDKSNCELQTTLIYSTGEENKIIEKDCPCIFSNFLSYFLPFAASEDPTDYSNISEDLWKLVEGEVLRDLELKAQNRSFFVHRIVLCARSPVFSAMLTHPMKEKEDGFIEIRDISAETLDIFLTFLYRDEIVPSNWIEAMELYCVADKYQVERLKCLCCSYLLDSISVDRVCELLKLADDHNDWELKRKVNRIVWRHEETVFTSPSWKKFAYEQETWKLATETVISKFEEKGKEIAVETYEEKLSKLPKIQDDFIAAYQSEIFSDIVIKTENQSFPAHKAVLCASSCTIREMLTQESKDNPTNVFEIKDLENDIISRLLYFLYSDSLKDIQWDIAIKLYLAAVVYQIYRLRLKCSRFLLENLRVSNAVELLLLAHEHRDDDLKSVVKNYISVYDYEIYASDAWEDFCETNSCLALEIMREKYERS